MCRHIVKNRVTDIEGLKAFEGEGEDRYSFSPAKSTAAKLVFLRCGAGGRAAAAASTRKRPASASAGGGAAAAKKRPRNS